MTNRIEFIAHNDGKAYANFDKTVPFEEYNFPVCYVFDKKITETK